MIQLAVIGCGDWGRNIVRTAQSMNVLGATCDPRHLADSRPFEEILTDTSISGIVIATPTPLHFSMARTALQAGKHVLIEKPFVQTKEEGEELIALAVAQNRQLMVGHLYHYHPAFLKVKELLPTVGPLRFIHTERSNFGKIHSMDSVLWDLGPHDLSMILNILGSKITAINFHEDAFVFPQQGDTAMLSLAFEGGTSSYTFLSRLHPHKTQKFIVSGRDGIIVFDDTLPWDKKVCVVSHHADLNQDKLVFTPGASTFIPLPVADPLRLELEHFVHCIATNTRPNSPGEEGLQVIQLINGIRV